MAEPKLMKAADFETYGAALGSHQLRYMGPVSRNMVPPGC
jgi:hypothetical protein